MAKTDIDSAFRLIPIHPLDHELLGFIIWINTISIHAFPWLAFFGLLRVSEITVTTSSPEHALLRLQVQLLGSKPQFIILHLTSYKHYNVATVPLQRNALKSMCPVKSLYKIYNWLTAQGPIFRYACPRPITATCFRITAQKMCGIV